MANRIKSVLLLGLMTGVFIAVGYMMGGQQGMIIAFGLAVAMNFFSYWFSDKIVLKMYRAQPIDPNQSPEIYDMVGELAANANLPMPRVYLIDDPTPNAFATGRNPKHAVVAMTSGVVSLLSRRELRGVMAHELSHVKNRDILVGSIAATLAGAIMMAAHLGRFAGRSSRGNNPLGAIGAIAMIILAPLGAMLIQMAISRSREYLADRSGASMSDDPLALAGALEKLQSANLQRPMRRARPESAHMFIVNPFSGKSLKSLFSTHPPIAERVRRLQAIGGRPMDDSGSSSGFYRTELDAVDVSHLAVPPPPPPPRGGSGGKLDWS